MIRNLLLRVAQLLAALLVLTIIVGILWAANQPDPFAEKCHALGGLYVWNAKSADTCIRNGSVIGVYGEGFQP